VSLLKTLAGGDNDGRLTSAGWLVPIAGEFPRDGGHNDKLT